MIQLNEGICYSPNPIADYLRTSAADGGLTAFFGDDLQVWNLTWLTDPKWDLWLDKDPDRLIQTLRSMDPTIMGLCKRALTMSDDLDDWGNPPLRDLLRLPPRAFMQAFSKKNIMCLELTATYGQSLLQTMWSRARLAEPLTTDAEVGQFVERAMGNVIAFRKRGGSEAEPASEPTSDISIPSWPAPTILEQQSVTLKSHSFHGTISINTASAKLRMTLVAEEIIAVLAKNPDADVKVTVEIQADFPSDVSDQTKSAVTQNAEALGFLKAEWE